VLFNGKDFAGWVKFIPNKNVDVDKVWTVKDGVIHCLGRPNGYVRTEKSYANYKLHFEWRWAANPTNSGCLVNMQLPDRVWPKCIECQLMHRNAGDFWILGGSSIKVDGQLKRGGRAAKKQPCNEKPPGEWNQYDIIVDGGTVKPFINGVQQNEGTEASVTSGYILLQSEGSPIEFRNIYLEPLEKK